jgi:hypothetical protein
MASVQFQNADDGAYPAEFLRSVAIGRERIHESPAPLMAENISSADAATAYRIRRGGEDAYREPPLPHSKRTSGSLYKWNDDKK